MELTAEQRLAVDAGVGALRIVAGPGSGKTRVLTQRIQRFIEEGLCPSHRILAVTFSVKATHEMRRRLRASAGERANAVVIRTLHALALGIVKGAPRLAGAPEAFELGIPDARRDFLLEEVLDELRRDPAFPPNLHTPELAVQQIARLKHSDPFKLLRGDRSDPVVRLTLAFDERLWRCNVVSFDDLGVMALRALERDAGLLESLQNRYRAVFVDEYQDIDRTQYEIVRRIGAHGAVTVVGDDDQCIYSWRGADPSFLGNFDKEFPEAATVHLSTNHRCPRLVVEAANAVVSQNNVRIPKPLGASKPPGPPIAVARLPTLDHELTHVVSVVADLLNSGVEPREVAVLSRNNDLLQAFLVRMRSLGLPVAGENPLRNTQGTSLLHLVRSVAEGPGDPYFQGAVNIGRRRMTKSTFRTIGGDTPPGGSDVEHILRAWLAAEGRDDPSWPALAAFIEAVAAARHQRADKPPYDVLSEVFDKLELPREPTGNPHLDELEAAVRLALEIARQRGSAMGADAFAEVAAEMEEIRQSGGDDESGVNALTVHRSKGLEFDHVIVMGVQGDIFPNYRFASAGSPFMEEERRLFYVALTRAKTSLLLTNHARNGLARAQSEDEWDGFISELPQHLTRSV